jgi:hypothetical protein
MDQNNDFVEKQIRKFTAFVRLKRSYDTNLEFMVIKRAKAGNSCAVGRKCGITEGC